MFKNKWTWTFTFFIFLIGSFLTISIAGINYYQRALPLIKEGKYGEALPLLERALEETPQDLFLKGDYLLCLTWTGAYEKAVKFYLKNEKELFKLKYLPKHIARAFLETGDFPRAKKLYEEAHTVDPADQEVFKGLIISLHRLREFSLAHDLLKKKEKSFPELASFLKALTLEKEEKKRAAYALYAQLTLKVREEKLLKEIQERRQEVYSSLNREDFSTLLQEFAPHNLLTALLFMDGQQYQKALKDLPPDYLNFPWGFLIELGWAFFKEKRYAEAINVWQLARARYPQTCWPRLLLVYPWAMTGKVAEGHKVIDEIIASQCFLIDALFAKAFLYEQSRDYLAALRVYEEILQLHPQNISAQKLRIYNLAELGATSLAYQEFFAQGIKDQELHDLLEGHKAVDHIRWEQTKEAAHILEKQLAANPQNLRARYDYIIALRDQGRMEEVLAQFAQIKSTNQEIPPWVLEAAADAYLTLKKPDKALVYYDKALALELRFKSLLGRFYALQDLREWKKAEQALLEVENFLKKERPESWAKVERVPQEGWFLPYSERLKQTLEYYESCFGYLEAKGWFLLRQDKLKEAEKFFESYLQKAGLSSDFRNGLAHTYLAQGKPRRALEEFKIIENIDPLSLKAGNGLALTLNTLNYKKEARQLVQRLWQQDPANKHIQNTKETFRVEDMGNIYGEGGFISENPGAKEYWAKLRLTEPVIPTFKLFQELLWQEAKEDDSSFTWNRAALGAEWIVFPELIWKQAATFDYQKMRDWGYATTLTFWPSDPLRLTAGFDSFSTAIPVRARAAGVEGKNAYLNIHYLESDLRYYGATLGNDWFSDDNQRVYGQLYYDQNILNRPDFKIRLGGEIYYGGYQKTDVPYFSPAEEFSFQINAGFHWLPYLFYEKEVRSSLYGRIGMYKQRDYSFYLIGGLTYEMGIRISRTFSLQGSISWDQKVYDGNSTGVWSVLLSLSKSF